MENRLPTTDARQLAWTQRVELDRLQFDGSNSLHNHGPSEWTAATAGLCQQQQLLLLGERELPGADRWLFDWVLLRPLGWSLQLQQNCLRNSLFGSTCGQLLRWEWVLRGADKYFFEVRRSQHKGDLESCFFFGYSNSRRTFNALDCTENNQDHDDGSSATATNQSDDGSHLLYDSKPILYSGSSNHQCQCDLIGSCDQHFGPESYQQHIC